MYLAAVIVARFHVAALHRHQHTPGLAARLVNEDDRETRQAGAL
jgi:hypothetical protein